ncbi:MAG TPA: hypothetical protein VGV14_09060 [Rhodanobacter sp.]|nr:hypothetical protein [Rhodanobacter sp.]
MTPFSVNLKTAALSQKDLELADVFDREREVRCIVRDAPASIAAVTSHASGADGGRRGTTSCCAADGARLKRQCAQPFLTALCVSQGPAGCDFSDETISQLHRVNSIEPPAIVEMAQVVERNDVRGDVLAIAP